jgi:hypothetical protein
MHSTNSAVLYIHHTLCPICEGKACFRMFLLVLVKGRRLKGLPFFLNNLESGIYGKINVGSKLLEFR